VLVPVGFEVAFTRRYAEPARRVQPGPGDRHGLPTREELGLLSLSAGETIR
jgi:hypothetical protein